MMPFIGARCHVWEEMLEYDSSNDDPNDGILGTGLPKMIDTYAKKMSINGDYTWNIDQHIVSYGIMSSGYCWLPSKNVLWTELNLKPK